jgi:Flp pilus assembly protein TadD
MWPQTYCRECGAVLVVSCAACGGRIMPDDKHCRYCGRLLGTDRVDPRAARAMHARMTAAQQAQAPSQDETVPETPAGPAESTPAMAAAEGHNQRGREMFDREDIQGAVKEFQAAVDLEPDNASYHCNLAVAYDENDQDELALREYEKTLELDPNDPTALLSLGYMYNENNQPEKARQAWDRILEIAPLSAEAQEVQDNLRHQGEL